MPTAGAVHVDVLPDLERFGPALRAQLKRHAKKGLDVPVGLDTAKARQELAKFRRRLDQVDREHPDVTVTADTRAAMVRLTGIGKAVDRLDGKTATVTVRTKQTGAVPTPKQAAANSGGGGKGGRPFTGMSPAVELATWTVGPAAVPSVAALTGALGGLSSGFVAAGVGAAGFALAAVPAIKEVVNAEGKLTAKQQVFADSLTRVKDEFTQFRAATDGPVLQAAAAGVDVATAGLDRLAPSTVGTAGALALLGREAEAGLGNPRWTEFFTFVNRQATPSTLIFGRTLGNLATGVTGLVMNMEPLWTRVGPGMEDLSAKFATWGHTSSNFTNFITWTIENGPTFLGLFGAIATTAVDVGVALGPLGTVYAQGLTVLAQALGWVAEHAPGLIQLAVAAKTASIAFGLFSRVNQTVLVPLRELPTRLQDYSTSLNTSATSATAAGRASAGFKGALGGVAGALGGPWGIAVTAALALGGLWLSQATKRSIAEGEWADSLRSSGGAIDENVKMLAAKKLAESGALAAAESAGISQKAVVEGLTQEGDKRRALLTLYDELHGAVVLNGADMDAWGNQNKEFTAALEELYGAGTRWKDLTEAQQTQVQTLTDSTSGLIGEVKSEEEAYRLVSESTSGQTTAQNGLNASTAAGAYQARDLRAALDGLTGTSISAAQAELNYKGAVDRASESVKQNGASTDLNTVAGQRNRQSLLDLASASNEHLGAMQSNNATSAQLRSEQESQRKAFIKSAQQMGYTKKEAEKLADEYLGIPSDVATKIKVNATGTWMSEKVTGRGPGYMGGLATGGPVHGAGTATSDSILAHLSDGEYVQNAAAVAHYGPGFMSAINERRIPKGALPGFATGGYVSRTSAGGSTPWERLSQHADTIQPEHADLVNALIAATAAKMAKDWKKYAGEGPAGVVKLAEASIGRYPESGGNNSNAITSWYGMSGQPWCAMFISWLFAQVGASKALGGAARTAWTGDYYTSGMSRASTPQPGDVAVYGRDHVNLVASPGGGRRIGGNQSNNVTDAPYSGGAIFRPNWGLRLADGGLVDILAQDRHQDNEAGLHPTLRDVRSVAGLASGGLADGWTVVGEQGPELARFDSSAQIYSNPESARILADARRVETAGRGGDGAASPLIGVSNIHLHQAEQTLREALGQLEHTMHTIDRGGRY